MSAVSQALPPRDPKSDQLLLTELTAQLLVTERMRQVHLEGYSPAHDDELEGAGELALAAACYAMAAGRNAAGVTLEPMAYWPWSLAGWKPRDAEANLVRAGALILAELERLRRASAKGRA